MSKKPIHQKQQSNHHILTATQTVTHYQGAVPHPDILRGIDEIVPGAAARIVKLAEDEANHRRKLEEMAMDANIATQQQQLLIEKQRSSAVFRSDMLGQIAGFLVCLSCIGAAIYLGIKGHDWLAGAIAAIPTAALIKAFVLTQKPK